MTKKKYYAVKVGKKPGIYETWDECKKQVAGFSGALYKSFASVGEANDYIQGVQAIQAVKESGTKYGKYYDIYVDGSYRQGQYSWAFVVYDGQEVIYTENGMGKDPEASVINNVAGELEAAVNAMKWAEGQKVDGITIHHDYIGISEWATGRWKTNNKFTKAYAAFAKPYISWVRFNKVAGHAGITGNELADKLAGEALNKG